MGVAAPEVEQRQNQLLKKFGLPVRLPAVPREQLLNLIHHDKKVFEDAPRWILPSAVGRAKVSRSVSDAELIAALGECAQL